MTLTPLLAVGLLVGFVYALARIAAQHSDRQAATLRELGQSLDRIEGLLRQGGDGRVTAVAQLAIARGLTRVCEEEADPAWRRQTERSIIDGAISYAEAITERIRIRNLPWEQQGAILAREEEEFRRLCGADRPQRES